MCLVSIPIHCHFFLKLIICFRKIRVQNSDPRLQLRLPCESNYSSYDFVTDCDLWAA